MSVTQPPCPAGKDRSQRWRDRRARFVPNAACFDPGMFHVDVIHCSKVAKPFVMAHHYSASFPATRLSCGLFRNGVAGRSELVGVCAFAVPMNNASIRKHTGLEDSLAGVDLGRLVLLDDVPGNAESWFVSRAFRHLRAEKPGVQSVISYSDPLPRVDEAGRTIMPGHIGMVYQGLSAAFRGRSSGRTDLMLPGGRLLSPRAVSKLRGGESGAAYVERQLLDAGLSPRRHGETAENWLQRLQAEGELRRRRHPGNLVYTFHLTKQSRMAARGMTPLPYPRPGSIAA